MDFMPLLLFRAVMGNMAWFIAVKSIAGQGMVMSMLPTVRFTVVLMFSRSWGGVHLMVSNEVPSASRMVYVWGHEAC